MASIYDLSAHINLSTLHLGLYGSLVIYRYIYTSRTVINTYIVPCKSLRLQFTTVLIFGYTVTIRWWLVDFSAETDVLPLCT